MRWFLFAFFQTHTVVILTLNQSSIVQSDRSSLFHPSIFFIIYCIGVFFSSSPSLSVAFLFLFLFPVYFSLLFSSLFPFPFPFPILFRFCFRLRLRLRLRFLFLSFRISLHNISSRYLFAISLHDISSQYHFTISLRNITSRYLFTISLHDISSQYHFTISLHNISSRYLFAISLHDISSISFNRLNFSLLSVKAVLLKKFAFPCLLTLCSIYCSASVWLCYSSTGIQIQLVLF